MCVLEISNVSAVWSVLNVEIIFAMVAFNDSFKALLCQYLYLCWALALIIYVSKDVSSLFCINVLSTQTRYKQEYTCANPTENLVKSLCNARIVATNNENQTKPSRYVFPLFPLVSFMGTCVLEFAFIYPVYLMCERMFRMIFDSMGVIMMSNVIAIL